MRNPCRACGACCALFKVSFNCFEYDCGLNGIVPEELTVDIGGGKRAMKGTVGFHKRCIALEGTVGVNVSCKIYDNRSSTCRSFTAGWEDGQSNLLCDRARATFGLVPFEPW